jgi:hypothetical protein
MAKRTEEEEIPESEDNEEEFANHFPALYKELKQSEEALKEEEMRTAAGTKSIRKFRGYDPGVIDFICRCKTEEEAIEIIDYMLKKGDISESYADELKKQLKEEGLEFFGEHRAPGYYERA